MPEIATSIPNVPAPIEILKYAVQHAHARRIRVRAGDLGVVCTSTHGPVRWEPDPGRREDVVSPLGAVLLAEQPPGADPHEAAAHALGIPLAWVMGLEDGLELAPKDPAWMASSRRALYEHGRESGVLLRLHVASFPSGGGRP